MYYTASSPLIGLTYSCYRLLMNFEALIQERHIQNDLSQ